MTEEYDLKAIEYESWDQALDEFNRAKSSIGHLSFDVWYEQQLSYLAFQKEKQKEQELLLSQGHLFDVQSFLQALGVIFKEHRDVQYEEEDEWDPWDEGNELHGNEEDNDVPF